ncbi:MAG: MarR family winged helix-turn-helix transcriptional regulator [Acidimicrobiales bacterium]
MTSEPGSEPLSVADYQALAAFHSALRVFLQFSERAARSAGLTPAQHQLLLAIKGHSADGPPTLGKVAQQLALKVHSASELVDRAVANDLLVRIADPADLRLVLLKLTPLGEQYLDALSRMHRDEVRRFRQTMAEVLDPLG